MYSAKGKSAGKHMYDMMTPRNVNFSQLFPFSNLKKEWLKLMKNKKNYNNKKKTLTTQ